MLINTEISLALCCAYCGHAELNRLSLFDFSGVGAIDYFCACGNALARVENRGGRYDLNAECPYCAEVHAYEYGALSFWRVDTTLLRCAHFDLEIGCIGGPADVQEKSVGLDELFRMTALGEYINHYHKPK